MREETRRKGEVISVPRDQNRKKRTKRRKRRKTHLQSGAVHPAAVELIPNDVPDRLRDDLVRHVPVRGGRAAEGGFRRHRHDPPRAVDAQRFDLGGPAPLVPGGAR